MSSSLEEAFLAASNGYSEDRVVCDPELNERFVLECRARGINEPVAVLNRSLLNLRKRGRLRVCSKSPMLGSVSVAACTETDPGTSPRSADGASTESC